jgi:hypothetical protein
MIGAISLLPHVPSRRIQGKLQFNNTVLSPRGRDSVVGTATPYGPEVPGIESRWGRDFPHSSKPALGPTQPPIQCVPGLFPGDKAAGAWRPTSSSVEVKERVEPYFYYLSELSLPVLG